jgi:uncharacterized protein (DUF427 family)
MSAGTGQIPDPAAAGSLSHASAQASAGASAQAPAHTAVPGVAERDYPQTPVPVNHVEPAPRRVRGFLGNQLIFDTTSARYVWEIPYYPQYYIPLADIDSSFLVDENAEQSTRRGTARRHGLSAGGMERRSAVRVYGTDAIDGVAGTAHFDWAALDAWYEEDEQVFVHPRSPYSRVDALRSHRSVRVSLDGVILAGTVSPVMVFETGLPTRYYIDRTDVDFTHLVPSETRTACPYKGITSAYWSVTLDPGAGGGTVRREHQDLAWAYDFPTRQLLPIAGMVAFYNEKLDIEVDGRPLPRPRTHFS